VAADLYRQITGVPIDGVIAMDPIRDPNAARLLRTDPAHRGPLRLAADNAAQFLLNDQYAITQDNALRIDALDEAGRRLFDALLTGALPDPTTLARVLSPLLIERLTGLVVRRERAGPPSAHRVTGRVAAQPRRRWMVALGQQRRWQQDRSVLRTPSLLRVDLRSGNGADEWHHSSGVDEYRSANGFPPYLIGNAIGLAPGTSRIWVSFYSSLPHIDASRDGEPTALSPGLERDWNVYSQYVNVPSGATVSYELHVAGALSQPDALVTWTQPLARAVQPL